ncbi:MAG: NAD(P)/FAD-dependent oxidoreductase [Oleiphilaceae bacterium]|nr:NAD(P)/FAD-dependent oxidoreductase [Oleiphilaceae bacterium]
MADTADSIIIGAGAAGLMCALTAAYGGQRVILIERSGKPGRKILMSGGGRCNFTNLNCSPANFLSDNPRFCISALKRYSPWDFLDMVERHGIGHEEKAAGQLFCSDSSKAILDMLLTECDWAGVDLRCKTEVRSVARRGQGFTLETSGGTLHCANLVVASGGLSIPTMGATGFGYELARQFGLKVLPTRAGLVPFTLDPAMKEQLAPLSGVSCPVTVRCGGTAFREPMLITHRGLSGPSMLQISSYWQPGQALEINLLPEATLPEALMTQRKKHPTQTPAQFLEKQLPKRFAKAFSEMHPWPSPFQSCSNQDLERMAQDLGHWTLKPSGTEGYRTAEVTLGGVDTREISSKTMAALDQPNLYFIGEVLDVAGHLGGHNFQWAWASAVAAANSLTQG